MSKYTWELNKKTGKMEKQKIEPYFPKAVLITVSPSVCEWETAFANPRCRDGNLEITKMPKSICYIQELN